MEVLHTFSAESCTIWSPDLRLCESAASVCHGLIGSLARVKTRQTFCLLG